MADQTVKIQQDTTERIALELMLAVASKEDAPKTRDYYFTLYYQCKRAVQGFQPKEIQKE
jgi:hypothetical protein